MARGVCLVFGAGSGIGAGIARRFARGGYTVCLVRRKDRDKLEALAAEIRGLGVPAHAHLCDGTRENDVTDLIDTIENSIGPIEVAVYNLGANVGDRPIQALDARVFTRAWQLGALGAFLVGKAVSKHMAARGRGTLIFTSATAAVRGNQGQAAHSAAMMGRRGVAMSFAHELAAAGVHVAHVVIDGIVDSPDTLGKFFPEQFQRMRDEKGPHGGIVEPDKLSETYWHLHVQDRCAWTFELDVRPWTDTAWFHTGRAENAMGMKDGVATLVARSSKL